MSTMEQEFAAYDARTAVLEKSTGPFAQGIAWVEGELVPLHEARIPLIDQGFMHSDLAYDVPAIWDGRFFRLDDHIARLEASCAKMRLKLPLLAKEVERVLVEMAAKSEIHDGFVELIVTRGLTGIGRGAKPSDIKNNLYMFIMPYAWIMSPEVQRTGGKAIIARTVRRCPPGSMDPTIKNLQWGDLTRGLLEAEDRDAHFPLLTDGDAHLTEGAGYNIVLIKNRVLYTPDRGVLQGVTRKSVIEVAQDNGLEVRVEFVPVEMTYQCDELLICSTAGGVMPITTLDGYPVNDGKVGPVTKKIWDGYWAMHYDPAKSFAINYDDHTQTKGHVNGLTNGH